MNRTVCALTIAMTFALALAQPALGQIVPRALSFAEVATVALQNNLQLRAASFEVAVARAQIAQARGGRMPQVTLSGSYTRLQEQAGQTLSFPNPFGAVPPIITVTLTPPDPNHLAVRLSVQYPLYTGGRVESQIALASARFNQNFARIQLMLAAGGSL